MYSAAKLTHFLQEYYHELKLCFKILLEFSIHFFFLYFALPGMIFPFYGYMTWMGGGSAMQDVRLVYKEIFKFCDAF